MARDLRASAYQLVIDELRGARESADMTQQALADVLRRPQSYVAKIETGERGIDVIEFVEWVLATEHKPEKVIAKISKTISE
ncbi:MAG: helix-turn-helix transcriptional regulator [Pseudomonadota bacterium]